MKKIICIVICFVCSMLLLSCTQDNLQNSVKNNIDTTDVPDSGEVASMVFYNISEYNDFISQVQPDEKFISYEKIRHLGDFVQLSFPLNFCYDNYSEIDYSSFDYVLRDGNGYAFVIYITHDVDYIKPANNITMTRPLNGMQSLGKETGVLTVDNIEYDYKKGALNGISWYDGNAKITVRSAESFYLSDYPADGNSTLLDSLINSPNDASNVAKTFLETIKNNY